MTEAEFMQQIVDTARWCGWTLIYHTHDSRRSPAGFPDLVLARPHRLIFAEVKTETGRVTQAQLAWIANLKTIELDTGGIVEAHIWRPRDFDQITATLQPTSRGRHQ